MYKTQKQTRPYLYFKDYTGNHLQKTFYVNNQHKTNKFNRFFNRLNANMCMCYGFLITRPDGSRGGRCAVRYEASLMALEVSSDYLGGLATLTAMDLMLASM